MIKKFIIAFGLVSIILIASLVGFRLWNQETETSLNQEVGVLTALPQEGTVLVSLTVPGLIEPVRTTSIRSSTPGTITSLVGVGSQIQTGEVIATLDQSSAQRALTLSSIQAQEAGINLERAETTLVRAQRTLDEVSALQRVGAASLDQVNNAQDSLVNAEQGLRLSQLAYQRAVLNQESTQQDLENTVIRAPFSGTVLSLALGVGDAITSNGVLGVLADLSRVRLVAEVDEFDISRIESGMQVRVVTEGTQAQNLNTTLEAISPSARIVNNISVFTMSAVVQNPNNLLRPGMTADLSVIIARDQGLVIPARSVTTVRGRSYVDVLVDDEPETLRVEIGANDGINVVVLSGLVDTSQVVLPPTAALPSFLPTALVPAQATSIIPVSLPGSGGGGGTR